MSTSNDPPRRETALPHRPYRPVAVLVAVIMAAGALVWSEPQTASGAEHRPPVPELEKSVAGRAARTGVRADGPSARQAMTQPPAVTWPQGAADVVRASAAKDATGQQPRVEVLPKPEAERAGVAGVVLRVTRADAGRAAGKADLRVDYSGFASAYGADYASRLRLISLPDRREINTNNDVDARVLTATVPTAAGPGTLVAVTPAPSGQAGDHTATPLAPSSTWDVGLQTGDFSWSYPMEAPPVAGDQTPELSLDYASSAVDGRTASTNNQASWAGEGFQLAPGFIERRYASCWDEGTETGDLCWARHNAVLSLNGSTTELIVDANGDWHPRKDDGMKIERLTGAQNGDKGGEGDTGEHWRVTDTEGTQYYFGRNRLPGWTTGKAETGSTWTVPVFGNESGEPCHASTFAASWCDQAWRWNLDLVVDPNGNATSYWYDQEINRYGRNLKAADDTPYTRGGYLNRIEYGLRDGNLYTQAPAQVKFSVAERCLPSGTITCAPEQLTTANARHWPDVPFDQNCNAGQDCTDRFSPTFWTRKRLATVTTQVWSGSAFTTVDSWKLTHTFPAPGDGTSPALWLSSVTRTGHVGGSAVATPPIRLVGSPLANRVDSGTDGLAPLFKYRLTSIYNETGGQVDVSYSGADCTAAAKPTPHTNTKRCFPTRWTPPNEVQLVDWFHKYVVTRVVEADLVAEQPEIVTTYDYTGGGAWHFDDADGLVPEKRKTWSEWRGFERVVVQEGGSTSSEHVFLRGMDGDKQPTGTRSASVTDSEGGEVVDHDAFAGQELEVIVRNGPGGPVVSKEINQPWRRETASRTYSWGTVRAHLVDVSSTRSYTALAEGFRQTRTDTTFDQHGLPTTIEDRGDVATAADDRCTTISYARNTAAWILDLEARTETVAVGCAATPNRPDDVVSDVRTSYDGGAYGTAPTKGNPTRTERLASYSAGSPVYQTVNQVTHDSYGRELTTTDAAGNITRTAYTAAVEGSAAGTERATNPLGHVTTTTYDPRGQPTAVLDPNDRLTESAYDGLGRLTAVWLPDRSRAAAAPASTKHEYHVSATAPSAVVTHTLRSQATYRSSYEIFDGLQRSRQTQSAATGGGRVIQDTFYDGRGQVVKERDGYFNDAAPSNALLVVDNDSEVPRQSERSYDGAGREVVSKHVSRGQEQWRTTTRHEGDRVSVTPPAGGTATTVITDARDRLVERRSYLGATPSGAFEKVTYSYDRRGRPATVTDNAGNVRKRSHDLRGRLTSSIEPDVGTTTYSYDDLDQRTATTDARGKKVVFVRDALGRETATHQGSATGPKLTETVFDTIARGQVTATTSFVDGAAHRSEIVSYDPLYRIRDRKITVPSTVGELARSYDFRTLYNEDGSVQSERFPAAGGLPEETVRYTYDDLGRQTQVRGLTTYVGRSVYSRTGNLLQRGLEPGGTGSRETVFTYAFDERTDNLASSQVDTAGRTESAFGYRYDPAGNITRIAETSAAATPDVQCFDYDHLRRLESAWTKATTDEAACDAAPETSGIGGRLPYWQSYQYDATGNRAKETTHGLAGAADLVRSYHYPATGAAQPHAVAGIDSTATDADETYAYDATGNLVERSAGGTEQTLEWDTMGRLASVTEAGATTDFGYDAVGSRLFRRTEDKVTLYLPRLELEHDKSTGATTAVRRYQHNGEVVASRSGGAALSWEFADHQGTATMSVSADQQAVARRSFDPFGRDRSEAPSAPSAASAGDWSRGFVGGTDDESTGLTKLGARLYEPEIGAFISADPILDTADQQQMQAYGYANYSPVTFHDASGLYKSKGKSWSAPAKRWRPAPKRWYSPVKRWRAPVRAWRPPVKRSYQAAYRGGGGGVGARVVAPRFALQPPKRTYQGPATSSAAPAAKSTRAADPAGEGLKSAPKSAPINTGWHCESSPAVYCRADPAHGQELIRDLVSYDWLHHVRGAVNGALFGASAGAATGVAVGGTAGAILGGAGGAGGGLVFFGVGAIPGGMAGVIIGGFGGGMLGAGAGGVAGTIQGAVVGAVVGSDEWPNPGLDFG